jgi:nucleoid-associated protein YgaU
MLIKFAGVLGVMIAAALVTWFGMVRPAPTPAPSAPPVVEAPAPQKPAATAEQGTGAPAAPTNVAAANPPSPAAPSAAAPAATPAPVATPAPAATAAPAAEAKQQADAAPAQAPASAAEPTPPAAAHNPAASLPVPTFDIVRVEPSGDTVVAGQGMPGATVELLRNGSVYARSVADVGGQWAIVPPPLPKGAAELSLRVTTPDGRMALSDQVVSVRVPEAPGEQVVVVLNAPDMPAKVLSDGTALASADGQATAPARTPVQPATPPAPAVAAAPQVPETAPASPVTSAPAVQPSQPAAAEPPAASRARSNAVIQAVEADDNGRFFVTGKAEPGADIRIYLNDTPVATVKAAKDGGFGLTVEHGMKPGSYAVRADDVDAKGKVLTRAEVPFVMEAKAKPTAPAAVVTADAGEPKPVTQGDTAMAGQPAAAGAESASAASAGKADSAGLGPGPKPETPAAPDVAPTPSMAVVPELRTVTIVRGDNLWRISRKTYGEGHRYTVIYDANAKQIRNPNLIYPGQIFVMPEVKVE